MRISTRERRLLLVLAVIGGLAGFWQLWQLARPRASAPEAPDAPAIESRGSRGARGRGTGKAPTDVFALALDRLDVKPADLAPGRDPFRFAPRTPPPPPPPTAAELEARRRDQEERVRLAAERTAAAAARPQPPAIDLRYLGSFGPRARPIAVFTDASTNVLNAREGDTLEGRFIVQKIGYESVDLAFVGFPDVPAQRLGVTAP